ncbi:MAG: hypothetical protein JW904_01640 [Spirochaetales bacterium]|nr:hypothetical protein [Spirochaetales bacterium]
MDDYELFFKESALAKKIKLPGRVVFHRTCMSSADIRDIQKNENYVVRGNTGPCDFEVNGKVLARGIIVKKRKGFFFKVTEICNTVQEAAQ